jgi:hypothetical protein
MPPTRFSLLLRANRVKFDPVEQRVVSDRSGVCGPIPQRRPICSPAPRTSAEVIAEKGKISTESTSICPDPTR